MLDDLTKTVSSLSLQRNLGLEWLVLDKVDGLLDGDCLRVWSRPAAWVLRFRDHHGIPEHATGRDCDEQSGGMVGMATMGGGPGPGGTTMLELARAAGERSQDCFSR